MLQTNFNRFRPSPAPPPEPARPFNLLHRIADVCARLAWAGQTAEAVSAVEVDGQRLGRLGPLERWAGELGWREGAWMKAAAAAQGLS